MRRTPRGSSMQECPCYCLLGAFWPERPISLPNLTSTMLDPNCVKREVRVRGFDSLMGRSFRTIACRDRFRPAAYTRPCKSDMNVPLYQLAHGRSLTYLGSMYERKLARPSYDQGFLWLPRFHSGAVVYSNDPNLFSSSNFHDVVG